MPNPITGRIAALEQQLKQVKKGQRLSHGASIEDSAIEVNDSAGSLRAIVGRQGDGTVGVQAVNGPPPPQPTPPIVASVLGGVSAGWDGLFDGGQILPMDWARVEVHASTAAGFTPLPETLRDTIETAQGATIVIPTDDPVYVRLVARNTSGTASTPSTIVGPLGPSPVVANDILDGIVTTVKLAEDAVTEAKLAAGAVGTVALADGAVLDAKLADNAVKVGKIAAAAVTAREIAAGAVTTDKLTVVGGANLLSDPSFEGAYTAGLVAGNADWSVAAGGNGSAMRLQVNATATTPTTKSLQITTVPILPGDQLFLAVDYLTSTDFTSTATVRFYVQWEDASGAIIDYGTVISTPLVVGGPWTRMAGTHTAPAGTVRATVWVQAFAAQAGWAAFDNASVRPVMGGTQIQDGAVTTQKIVAGAVQAGTIAAGAVNADKIAAAAVTTAKLDALAVTTDKIAANAITADKILAGSITATSLAADAITGKTVTGGLLQTATTGERITINEGGANMVLVYDATGATVGELSARGLRLAGDSGAYLFVDPDDTYPNVRWSNAARTNWARAAVVESTPGAANLEIMSGTFTQGSYTDMRTRLVLADGALELARMRSADPAHARYGGRLYIDGEIFNAAFVNSDNTAESAALTIRANYVFTGNGRFAVSAPASAFSALYAEAPAGHTGNLFRLNYAGNDRFTVDTSGNATVVGKLTAGNMAYGSVSITPSAANTPTSTTITYPALAGTTFRGFASANTTVPGSRINAVPTPGAGVTGVSLSSVTATSALVWLNRENTTTTTVNWQVIAE